MASFATTHVRPYDALTKAVAANPLTGKSFLITDAGRGVGEHITRELVAAGAQRIGLVGRNLERISEAKKRFEEAFPKTVFEAFAADVRFINCHPGSIKSDGFSKSGAPEPPTGMTDGKVAG
ncbi:hypothetical protein V8C34DRAFT_307432 [Trichoderma compactum]